ncbi:MAG TPA: protein translocase subunit SecF [Sphingomonadales bacterium]
MLLKLVPDQTNIPFMRWRMPAIVFAVVLTIASIALVATRGMNFGVDFAGGILIEIKAEQAVDLGQLRSTLGSMNIGEVSVQSFGADEDEVLIRLQHQEGDQAEQEAVVERVKTRINEVLPGEVSFRRVEYVGPKVSDELVWDGIMAVTLSMIGIMIYVWMRFEWQFAVGAVLSLIHDVALTLGLFSLFQLEFNLSVIAALLTIVGYSLNDTVVVYDRIRENLRKYRRMDLNNLIDLSLNETLSRTIMTGVTTLLALFALYVFGGEVISAFTLAMIWGVLIGPYSTVFIAAPVLPWFNLKRDFSEEATPAAAERP